MKKIYIIIIFLSAILCACEKGESKTTIEETTSVKEFYITFAGKQYKGTSAELKLNPEEGNSKYKNFLLVSTTDFTLCVFNIPTSGSVDLNGGFYDATAGDVAMTYTKGNSQAEICTGTIDRVTENT